LKTLTLPIKAVRELCSREQVRPPIIIAALRTAFIFDFDVREAAAGATIIKKSERVSADL